MKRSITLHDTFDDEKGFYIAISAIHDLLLNDSSVIHGELFREEGPYTDPKISSYILSNFGDSIVDYSSHQKTPERFEKGDIWINVISENPMNSANYIANKTDYRLNMEEFDWAETVFNYARMKERLKLICDPQDIKPMLECLRQGTGGIRRLNENHPVFFDVFKGELSKNLYELWEGV